MKAGKKLLIVLMVLALMFSLAACGEDEDGGDAGSVNDGVSQNGGADYNDYSGDYNDDSYEENYDDYEDYDDGGDEGDSLPFHAGDGEPLDGLAGYWVFSENGAADIDNVYYINENGTWGSCWSGDPDDTDEQGPVKYEKGTLYLCYESSGEFIELTSDGDSFVYKEDDSIELMPINKALAAPEILGHPWVVCWKDMNSELWLEMKADASWRTMDASGSTIDEGHVYVEDEKHIRLVGGTDYYPLELYFKGSSSVGGGLVSELGGDMDMQQSTRVPGETGVSESYTGYWTSGNNYSVYIAADGTWTEVDPDGSVIRKATIETSDSNIFTTTDETGGVMSWQVSGNSELQAVDAKLYLSRIPVDEMTGELPEEYQGLWYLYFSADWVELNADMSWRRISGRGSVTDSGKVYYYEDEYNAMIVMLPDGVGYPLIFTKDDEGLTDNSTSNDLPTRKIIGGIPAEAELTGLWKVDTSEVHGYIRFYHYPGLTEDADYGEYSACSIFNENDEFGASLAVRIDEASGELQLFDPYDYTEENGEKIYKTYLRLNKVDENTWVDAAGETMNRVEDVFDDSGYVRINGYWYYEAKDMYIRIDSGNVTSGTKSVSVTKVDKDRPTMGSESIGSAEFGLEPVFTMETESETWVLTLNADGSLTDADGNELIRTPYLPFFWNK